VGLKLATIAKDLSIRTIEKKFHEAAAEIPPLLISSDSHVDEPADLWKSLPQTFSDDLPIIPDWPAEKRPQGGKDPKVRIEHMDLDGVAAEILYPTALLRAFRAPQKAQEAAFRLYNDWVAEYCSTSPERLFAIPCLCTYDIDYAIAEMHRCHDLGLLGGLVWQVPDPALPFTSDHYDKLWAAAGELGYPINLHILSGHSYNVDQLKGPDIVRASVNTKTADTVTTLFDFIWSGVFDRFPKFKMELVESEIGWMPFTLQQWDYYYQRFSKNDDPRGNFPIHRLPSDIFYEHVYATFMDDYCGSHMLKIWGHDNCMWSSDYPHGNMTWPESRAFIAKQIGNLDYETQEKLTSKNVKNLYKLKI
jgi:predicted TIM-barrel fold metal-dependent hydrolase